MTDLLDILTSMNIGYALWNLRGPFGILDSERRDVDYEDWQGHKLDRRMLDLLKRH
jgi:endoglucanase